MNKHISIISTAVLLGGVMLLGGCTKSPFSRKGETITFGTVASGSLTRAAYGDDFPATGTPTLQRIDWEEGDAIRVVSDNAAVVNNGSNLKYADYTVGTITQEADGSSSATVENAAANGLAWTGAETYSFWAVYPSTATIGATGTVETDFIKAAQAMPTGETSTRTVGDVTYTIYTPDLSAAVMTAVATGVKENDDKPQVKLHFKPAWTAIEFNLSSQDDDIEVTELQLVADAAGSDYLAGPFTMTAGDLSSVAVNTASASRTATLSVSGVTLTETEGASLTMFILPVDNASALKLRLTSKEDDGTKTSAVSLTRTVNGEKVPFVFEAGKKYRINGFKAPGSSWKIFIATDIMNVDDWGTPVDTELIVE